MQKAELRRLFGFYENELSNQILSFWLPRCLDTVNGGYFNCYDNRGEHLVSHDKYTWSQGRFVWMYAKLAQLAAPIFTREQREHFLALAKSGRDFLMAHCLMGENDWRCTFLMEEDGTPKYVDGCDTLDMSIYADCFVVIGLGKYAEVAGDKEAYTFAKRLYDSICARIESGVFNTLPYPLSSGYRAHGIPMILSNVSKELHGAAAVLCPEDCPKLLARIDGFTQDILTHFADENHVIHEVITKDNAFFPDILGQHANPGHTIEDMWFMIDAADLLGKKDVETQACAIAKKAYEIGWDEEMGGILHFSGINGGKPEGDPGATANEPMCRQLSGWDDKLWWIHSEALYTALLCYDRTGDEDFLAWHDKVFAYTFSTFPNRDPEIREWMQIRMRDGRPQEKVVALPVKDPFHITRNLCLILELLSSMLDR